MFTKRYPYEDELWILLSKAPWSISLLNNYFEQLLLNFFFCSVQEKFGIFKTNVSLKASCKMPQRILSSEAIKQQ